MKIRIFTDGACSENPGPGGWAAVFNTPKKCFTISGFELMTTNNRMELQAVVESIRKVSTIKNADKIDFELYSDSAYVVNAINNKWVEKWRMNGWKTTKQEDVKNRELWEEFMVLRTKALSCGIYVQVIKIKGHAGNTFNEMVDRLAKEEVLKAKEVLS